MDAVFQWVKSLAYYLILVSLLSNLIANGKYDRYIRLFTGAVFILLVIRPLSGGLGLEEKLAYAYEKIRLKQDTGEFESRLWGMEEERTRQVILQYEEAVAQDVKRMALDAGLVCREARAVIESDPEQENFGQVKTLSLILERGGSNAAMEGGAGLPGGTETSELENGAEASEKEAGAAETVEPVQIRVGESGSAEAGDAEGYGIPGDGGIAGPETETRSREERLIRQKEQEALYGFQRRLAVYYGLEEENIRITWQDD